MDFIGKNGGGHQKKTEESCHKVADALSQQGAKFLRQTIKFLINLSSHTFDKEKETDGKGNDVIKDTEKQQPACRLISIYGKM